MSIDKDRLRRLVRAGRLTAREAAQMGQALDQMERSGREPDERSQRKPALSQMSASKVRFLAGETDEEQFFAEQRRVAVHMGVGFALLEIPILWFIAWSGLTSDPLPELPRELSWEGLLLAARLLFLPRVIPMGLFFGWSMHRFFLLPRARRLAELQSEVDLRAEPLEQTRPGQCPTCGAENKKTWTTWSPAMLHWVLNPGLAFNEVVLGQRIARECHHCLECGSSFIDCRTCQTSVDALDWSVRSQFGRWRGIRCARCGGSIPCTRNALALIIEAPVRLAIRLYRQLSGRTEANV